MSNKSVSVYAEAMKRKQEEEKQQVSKKAEPEVTQNAISGVDTSRDKPKGKLLGRKSTRKSTQKVTHLLRYLSKNLSTDAMEGLSFGLRKTPKVRVNADVPAKWKEELDNIAHEKKVGKYELLLYVIAVFLGKERPEEIT